MACSAEEALDLSRVQAMTGGVREERGVYYSKAFAYVTSSSYRQRTLEALADNPMRPRDLARRLDLGLPHVSRALFELGRQGLVERLPGSLPKALAEEGHRRSPTGGGNRGWPPRS